MLTVIIPASNEAGYIGPCLAALFAEPGHGAQAIVVANGCHDATAATARAHAQTAIAAGWSLLVIERALGSKPGALNAAEAAALHPIRAYLDADVVVSPGLIAALAGTLAPDTPLYATGTAVIPRPNSAFTRAYAGFWQALPFARCAAPGFGLFAANAAGRARWLAFPDLISDDTFVRLHFAPSERVQLPQTYLWPMIEGFSNLARVRARQDAGVRQLMALHPDLFANEAKPRLKLPHLARLALRDPLGFAAYTATALRARLTARSTAFTRGR